MNEVIELLSVGDWRAWAGLIVAVLLVLWVIYKCITNLGKILLVLFLIGLLAYGLSTVFTDQASQMIEKMRTLLPSENILEDEIMLDDL
ncbi:MAG: Uncharacterised protein [Opitutia bacterium UBA7350]|nr:MAG: Uncharacterised protein [Opitutae bacterium UBA7350]